MPSFLNPIVYMQASVRTKIWHYCMESSKCFYCVFNSLPQWHSHLLIFVSIFTGCSHWKSVSFPLVQRTVVSPKLKLNIIWNIRSSRKGTWSPLCNFCIGIALLASRKLHQRSQPRNVFKWKLCKWGANALKSCWRAWNALMWGRKTPSRKDFKHFESDWLCGFSAELFHGLK